MATLEGAKQVEEATGEVVAVGAEMATLEGVTQAEMGLEAAEEVTAVGAAMATEGAEVASGTERLACGRIVAAMGVAAVGRVVVVRLLVVRVVGVATVVTVVTALAAGGVVGRSPLERDEGGG